MMEILIQTVVFMIKLALLCIIICSVYWAASYAESQGKKDEEPKEVKNVSPTPKLISPQEGAPVKVEEIHLSLDAKTLVQVLLNDPTAREEIYAAVREGP